MIKEKIFRLLQIIGLGDVARKIMAGKLNKRINKLLVSEIKADAELHLEKTLAYNASINKFANIKKMQTNIQLATHSIEKGFSIRNTKAVFGVNKIDPFLDNIELYINSFGHIDMQFLKYPLRTISNYISYIEETSPESVANAKQRFLRILKETGIDISADKEKPFFLCRKQEIAKEAQGDFRSLLYSRHSIRSFTPEIPDRAILDQALTLASRTPSACNRQGWRTHIFTGENAHRLLEFQGYCNGFYNDIHCVILVSADLSAFIDHEIFMPYIDGGLYAMNLINSLHFLGLGTIPLCCSFHAEKTKRLAQFGLPDNEVPVVLIGCGCLEDEFKVAASDRYDISRTNKYIDEL